MVGSSKASRCRACPETGNADRDGARSSPVPGLRVDAAAARAVQSAERTACIGNAGRAWTFQSCLLPNLDLLLPKLDSAGGEEVFFVVVFADDQGAAVIAARIREEFGQLGTFTQAGLTLSLTYKFLGPTAIDPAASFGDTVGKMAARLAVQLKSETHTRSIHGE